jgi:glutamate-1-semialdehyde 2,1-aminomutase
LLVPWVGTGRFILSHDYTDDQVDEVIRRFTAAAKAMEADGWFWRDPTSTAAAIQSSIAREIVRAAFRGRRSVGQRAAPAPQNSPAATVTR